MSTTTTTAQQIKIDAYIDVRFPSLNKNETLAYNDEEIERRSSVSRCQIQRVIELNLADFCDVSRTLMNDSALWGKIGGQDLSPLDHEAFRVLCREHGADADKCMTWVGRDELISWFRTHSFTCVVAVTCQGQLPFFVNTEGHSYARYVGRAA